MKEPVAITTAIMATLQTALMLLVSFGVDLSEEQTAAIIASGSAVLMLVGAIYMRSRVTPV
jgi:uncharacterized membrane protein